MKLQEATGTPQEEVFTLPRVFRAEYADPARTVCGIMIHRIAENHTVSVRTDSHRSARNSADSPLFHGVRGISAVHVREFRVFTIIIDIIIYY